MLKMWIGGLLMIVAAGVVAATQNVAAQGDSGTCWRRDTAMKMAVTATKNDAREECRALGRGWRMQEEKSSGYPDCRPCGSSGEFKCQITKAVYSCFKHDAASHAPSKADIATSMDRADVKKGQAQLRAQQEHNRPKSEAERATDRIPKNVTVGVITNPSPGVKVMIPTK